MRFFNDVYFFRDEKKKFKKLQREVDKMAALMKDEDDEDEDGEDKDDGDNEEDEKEESEAEESESEESESGDSDSESEESEPEVRLIFKLSTFLKMTQNIPTSIGNYSFLKKFSIEKN